MTPAIVAAKRAKIPYAIHEYHHDPKAESYGEEAAEALGLDQRQVFKTLVVDPGNQQFAVAIVPVVGQLDLKLMAKALGEKKCAMADKQRVERVTGYVLGGVSPLGQKKRLPTVIDSTAQQFDTIFVSAGRRGLEIELKADDLAQLCNGRFADIGR